VGDALTDERGKRRRGLELAAVAVTLLPVKAWADAGEHWLGVALAAELPGAAGGLLESQLGLSDRFSARLSAGGFGGTAGAAFDTRAGLVWAWDVFSYVPELAVTGGIRVDRTVRAEVALSADVRHYLSLNWTLSVGGSGGFRSNGEWFAGLSLGVWRLL
jgi:hypothetical protein